MAMNTVCDFLKEHNRPFSANDIFQQMGKEQGRVPIQKALDALVSKSKVIEKVYGKQKVYCIAQDTTTSYGMDDNLRKMDQEIDELAEKLKTIEEQLRNYTTESKSLHDKLTTEEAQAERNKLKDTVSELNMKVAAIEPSINIKAVNEVEKVQINMERGRYLKEYKNRKRICMDIINAVLEGYPKTKKHLFEDIGLETDEDVGFKVE